MVSLSAEEMATVDLREAAVAAAAGLKEEAAAAAGHRDDRTGLRAVVVVQEHPVAAAAAEAAQEEVMEAAFSNDDSVIQTTGTSIEKLLKIYLRGTAAGKPIRFSETCARTTWCHVILDGTCSLGKLRLNVSN